MTTEAFSGRPVGAGPLRGAALWRALLPLVMIALIAVLFTLHAFQYFSDDDEEGYAYAAWRISAGDIPYRDILTPQLPAFLYTGALIVKLFGRSYIALRLVTIVAALGATALFWAINRELFGESVALLALPFFVLQADVFYIARYFRPDVYMLLYGLAGTYLFILAQKRGRLAYLFWAGLCFGLAVLSKLFGVLLLLSCYFYILYSWWVGRHRGRSEGTLRTALGQSLALGLPALALVGAVAAAFSRIAPYVFTAVIGHHTMQGADLALGQRLLKAARFFLFYGQSQPLAVALAVTGAVLLLRRGTRFGMILICQLPTALSFFVLSRSLLMRHLTYLVPTMATLASLAVWTFIQGRWRFPQRLVPKTRGAGFRAELAAIAVLAMLVTVYPWEFGIHRVADLKESDSFRLAQWIQELTTPDELVMADYPGINFLAERKTTYWVSGISGGAAESGQIRGSMLIAELQQHNVAMVIINTVDEAHQMISMREYPAFRRYVQEHYALIDVFHRGAQDLEIYYKRDIIPLKPGIRFSSQIELTGARLAPEEVPSGTKLNLDLRWRAIDRMPRDYHLLCQVVDARGLVWAERNVPILQLVEIYPTIDPLVTFQRVLTSQWEPGQIVLHELGVPLSPGTPPGTYTVTLRVHEDYSKIALQPQGGEVLPSSPADAILSTIRVLPGALPSALESLAIPLRSRVDLLQELAMLGTGPVAESALAGKDLGLDLYWLAIRRIDQAYRLEFRLLGEGAVRQRWVEELARQFPTTAWREGEVVLGRYSLPLNKELPDGRYTLLVAILDSTGHTVVERVLTESVTVRTRPDVASLRERIANRLDGLVFGEAVELLGYDLSATQAKPGQTLVLTLYWLCQKPLDRDYIVFTHLLDNTGRKWAQRDSIPDEGRAPTSGWLAGDVVVDRYVLPLTSDTPPGELHFEIGFYDGSSQERLTVSRDGQRTEQNYVELPSRIAVSK